MTEEELRGSYYDDYVEYLNLCRKYGEKPVMVESHTGNKTPLLYGEHHNKLLERNRRRKR